MFSRTSFKQHAVMTFLAVAFGLLATTPMAVAAASGGQVVATPVPSKELNQWHEAIRHTSTPSRGCFHADYPSTAWTQDACVEVPLQEHPHPLPRMKAAANGAAQTVGDGNDYVVQAPALITQTVASFSSVTGVTSESGVNVPFNGSLSNGITGPNEYSLQINSQYSSTTAACNGHVGCTVWQQFLYSTDYTSKGSAKVYIQYWLIGYGNGCPGGWAQSGSSCYKNSSAMTAPDVPATQLANLKLTGTAASGGNDSVVFTNGTTAYTVTASDSVLYIGSVWRQSEFNVVGDAGGSQAQFNAGSSMAVNVAVTDGSLAAPTCLANAGSTGETNNLNLANTCCPYAGTAATANSVATNPSIAFVQSNASPAPTVTCSTRPALTITTVAGGNGRGYSGDGGSALAAQLQYDNQVAVDAAGNIYIADKSNQRVRKVNASTGIITTVAGNGVQGYSGDGGLATSAELNYPASVGLDSAGNLYIADWGNYRVRKVSASTGIITTIAGTGNYGYSGNGGPASQASVLPWSLAVDAAGNIYIADASYRITKITASSGIITTLAGNGTAGDSGDGGAATSAVLNPYGIAADSSGNVYFSQISDNVVRKITASTGLIARIAGNGNSGGIGPLGDGGAALSATLNFPNGLAADHLGNVYITEGLNYRVRRVVASSSIINTVAGNGTAGSPGAAPIGDGGPATSAVVTPNNVALDATGNMYISDGESYSVRKVAPPLY